MSGMYSTLLCLVGCCAALGLSASPAQSERLANGARFGEWTVVCEAVAVNETVCVLNQRLVRNDGEFLVDLLAIPGGDGWLSARVPVGVHFPGGFVLRREGDPKQIALVWQVCSPRLCEAAVSLADEGAVLLEGGEAIAAYRPEVTSDPVVFRVVLDGLADGLAALAASIEGPPQGDPDEKSE